MEQNFFKDFRGVNQSEVNSAKYFSISDAPELSFRADFLGGEKYRIVGKFVPSNGCFPQPTLKVFNPQTKKTKYLAFYYEPETSFFELIFSIENTNDVVTFMPFFQHGAFEIKEFSIAKISTLDFEIYKVRKKIRPYVRILGRFLKMGWQGVKLFRRAGLKTTFSRILGKLGNSYTLWTWLYDRKDFLDRMHIKKLNKQLKKHPKISIVMPVYNVDKKYFVKAIESVRSQVYQNWELCVADDCSTESYIRPFLKKLSQQDSRIKIILRETNGHISEATNSALALASGEYIALMDHDDVLVDSALVYVASAIEKNPECALIYSDEDKIGERGRRFYPFFKPDWSPDLFFSMNILTHLNVFKADIVRKIKGFRKGYEGSQDYDFCLRFLDEVREDQIIHIPKVLYHWRAIKGSVALDSREKQYAHDNARKSITEFHERRGIKVKVVAGYGPLHRVLYEYKKEDNKVSIIICTRDAKSILKVCIDSILQKTEYANYEIIIVDNSSVERETLSYFEELKKIDFVKVVSIDCPFNYSYLNNEAVKHASGNILCFLNNDIEVLSPNWLDELVMHAQRLDIGAVGAKLFYPGSGGIQHFGIVTGIMGGVAGHPFKYFNAQADGYFGRLRVVNNVSAVTGACLVTRKTVFESVGGFDEKNLAIAYNDVDLCLKILSLNLRNLVTPFAELIHHESLTRGHEDTPEKLNRLRQEQDFMKNKWGGGRPLKDRFYNPNLTVGAENYNLAWPPRQD